MQAESGITTHRVINPGVQIFGLVLCVALTIVCIRIPHWIPRIVSIFTGVFSVLTLFFRETRIDISRGVVVEVCRILDIIPFSKQERSIQEFAGISCYCSSGVTNDNADTWTVSLHPRSGRAVEVRQFSVTTGSEDCSEARAFALGLSRETGLELIDHVA
jgi:hypothetical protein